LEYFHCLVRVSSSPTSARCPIHFHLLCFGFPSSTLY
jgi:hypothetical protein